MEQLTCVHCGRPCLKDAIVSVEPIVYVMCTQCYSKTKTCAMCIYRSECLFETSSCPLPKQIQKTVRQGPMIMETVVQNPDRIRETCQNGCKCWSADFGCLKQNGICASYEEVAPHE